jgi:ketosteroid isomerase-like protein
MAGALGVALCLGLGQAAPAAAQESPITAQTVVDRAKIEDLLTRYYYNFGKASADSFSKFYTDDAELVLGPNSFKGKDGIERAYKGAGQNAPQLKSFSFNVLMTNPLIVVHGDTATARLIFTEVVIDTQGAAPHVIQQGHEFDNLVKAHGQWLIKKRQIMSAAQVPPDWTD